MRNRNLHKIYDLLSEISDKTQPSYIYCLTSKKFNYFIKECCSSNYSLSMLLDTLKQSREHKYNYIRELMYKYN